MTYLDYAINASLVLSYMAMRKEDKAGIVTFSSRFEDFVPASRHTGHMQNILEILYRQQTRFAESDYSALVDGVNLHVSKRSLLVLYTSFANRVSMERQLPYLLQLNRRHRLLVVFFEDDEVKDYLATRPHWAMDGNAIIFTSNRLGLRSQASWGSQNDIFVALLNQETFDKFNMSEEENARVASMRFSHEYLKAQSERMERLCREQSEKERLRRRKKNSSKSGQ